ncbi:MAG: cobalamin-dependent protein [Proteobacteria bacterium]|nr:cobalamin-dependent protein [Pseudomonadota bacterium]
MSRNLSEALAAFEEDQVMGEVDKRLEDGVPPIEIVRELQAGMAIVGSKFESGEFYLSELMMSADLFTRAMALLEPKMEAASTEYIGRIVIGTPKGDIHDIGKNIFCTVAKGAGFEVHDLGVDVPPDRFVAAVEELKPDILAFSALLTTAFQPMKKVVEDVQANGRRQGLKIIVGGGVVNESVKTFIGADGFTKDAMDGLGQCKRFLGR